MDLSNQYKSKHGANAQNNLSKLLGLCLARQYIQRYEKEFRAGYSDYANPAQFYAPFIIEYHNGEKWLLYSSTSLRTDRIKGNQWDAYHLKKIDKTITKAILVYADSCEEGERSKFIQQRNKYLNKFEYSALDDILNHSELMAAIERHYTHGLNIGKAKDIIGRTFEERVSFCLSYPENLRKWKGIEVGLTGLDYSIFTMVLEGLRVDHQQVQTIRATTSPNVIGKLPSGGNPKTDILLDIEFIHGGVETFAISCKKSSDKKVSVHQYTAESFSQVLDPKNQELRGLLDEFQKNPSLRAFGMDNGRKLEEVLKPYHQKLNEWVLAGIGGGGDPLKHWVTHLLIYSSLDDDSHEISFYSLQEYLKLLEERTIRGHFGTCFDWTYPSKRRGKSIQLKCKML